MKAKRTTRAASLFLAVLLSALSLSGCGETKENSADPAEAVSQNAEAAAADPGADTEPEETELHDDVPDTLKYDGTTIRIFVSNGSGQNEELYAGQGELTGDVENDAIMQRNMTAEDRLDIKLEYINDEALTASAARRSSERLIFASAF